MIYQLEAPFAPWLWPLLELVGIGLQFAGFIIKQKYFLPAGWVILMIGCWRERDITLAVGDALAAIGLYCYLRKQLF